MDPLTLSLLVYAGVIAVVYIVVTLKELYGWFRNRNSIKGNNKDIIAFTLAQKINGRNYVEVPGVFTGETSTQVVQGLFDRVKNRVLDGRLLKSNKATEAEVIRMHDDGDGLVVYA